MANRVTTLFTAETKSFSAGIKSMIADVKEADGLSGKFKAGISGLGDTLKANAAGAAVAAGAALVAFAAKAVSAFTDSAKAAIDFGAATGLAVEDASRWIAVGDDVGVKAGELEAAFGKVGKSLDSKKWSEYGIATRDAGGQARTTNDIILDTFDVLAKTNNETERVRIGNDLFGKSYANMAPLVGKTRKELEGYLGSVKDGQVITSGEAAKAEKWRMAMDDLGETMHEVTLKVGELVASQAPLLQSIAKALGLVTEVGVALGEYATGNDTAAKSVTDMRAELEAAGLDWADYAVQVDVGTMSLEDVKRKLAEARQANLDLLGPVTDVTDRLGFQRQSITDVATETDHMDVVIDDFNRGTGADFKQMLRDTETATNNLTNAVSTLQGHLDFRAAVRDFEEAMFAYRSATQHSEEETDTFIGKMKTVIETANNIPTEVKTTMIAQLDQGNIDAIESRLAFLARNRTVSIGGQLVGADVRNAQEGRGNATGGRMSAGEASIVGEAGRAEVFVADRPGRVYPSVGAAERSGAIGSGIVINLNTSGIYGDAALQHFVSVQLSAWADRLTNQLRRGAR